MVSPTPSTQPDPPARGALAAAMIALAGTPDHCSSVGPQVVAIARLSAERVAAARYAAIIGLRRTPYPTVAVSHELIEAVDEVQSDAGLGFDAAPGRLPGSDTTVEWPGFHEVAPRLGLQSSVSVPLFAGRGAAVAVLTVYSHDRAAMVPLITGICAVHGRSGVEPDPERQLAALDPGGRELVIGYAEALTVRATVRLAIELIKSDNRCSAREAYLSLCVQAGAAGTDLTGAATALIGRDD